MSFDLSKWKELLSESSLSRIYRHIQKTDVAIITAYRDDPFDLSKCLSDAEVVEADTKNPRASNLLRNRNLKAVLLSKKYGVTKVKGSYIEDFDTPQAIEVKENSLFVVNLEQDPNFVNDIVMLGKKFCQDSVLIITTHLETSNINFLV